MSLIALGLVLLAALLHASWNLWLKSARLPAFGFTWCCSLAVTLVWLPVVLSCCTASIRALEPAQWAAVTASALLHVGYFLSLQHGYARADLSIVYPVARGTGPLMAALAAIVLFDEPATPASLGGLALIVAGTLTVAGGLARLRAGLMPSTRAALAWGLLTAAFIAAYTLNDGRAVRVLAVAPLLVDWLGNVIRVVLLAPWALVRRTQIAQTVRMGLKPILGIAIISPAAYILVLKAMQLAPISRVAPAREISMLIAAFMGAKLLGEGELGRRLAGAALMACGVVLLALD